MFFGASTDGGRVRLRGADSRPQICLGFDGSRSEDWSAIRAETVSGFRFTPRYGFDKRPCIWDPGRFDGRIPRSEVDAAVDEIMKTFRVARFYCDPHLWETQIDEWGARYGEDVVVQWPTNRTRRMHEALVRFQEDLREGLTTHSYDQTARTHALHARRRGLQNDTFILAKPAKHMKIDVLMSDILAHEAAADARATGWGLEDEGARKVLVLR